MEISATIITLNEESNIEECLQSLDFADEIVVVDSGSTDRTAEICRSNTKVRFYDHGWLGFGRQKNFAASLARHDWILNIDADERVSPALREAIMAVDPAQASCYRVARENYFGKRWIRRCGWYPNYQKRFYDRRVCAFNEKDVHESVECPGKVGVLKGNLVHKTYAGLSDYLKRMERYSTLAARELVKAGKRPGVLHVLFKPCFTFIKMYFLKLGFLEGYMGLVLSVLYSQYTFYKYGKAVEMIRAGEHG